MSENTIHASAVSIGGTGVLILGASGAGKSALALDLIEHCRLRNIPAMLIGDDRIILSHKDGEAVAAPAPALAGLIEVRGSGIHRIDHVSACVINLAVQLVDLRDAVRMPPAEPVEVLPGVCLPLLLLPLGQPAVRAVLARLGLYGGVKLL